MPPRHTSLLQLLALAAIRYYQAYISPHKGFACAHRVHMGGLGCSGYGYRVIARTGLAIGLRLLQRRMHHCRAAHLAYSPPLPQNGPNLAWRRSQAGFIDASCDCPSADCAGADSSCAFDALSTCSDCDLPELSKKNRMKDSKAWERAKAYNDKQAREQQEREEPPD